MPGIYDLTPGDLVAESNGVPNMQGGGMGGVAGQGMAQEDLMKLVAQFLRGRNSQFDPKIMTPENAEAMSQLGIMPEQSALRESERDYAQALRDSPMPEGRQGRQFYTAASPLEFAAKLGRTYVGASRERELMEQQRDALQQQKALRAQYMTALGQMGGAPQGMQPQPMGNPVPGAQPMGGGGSFLGDILRGVTR